VLCDQVAGLVIQVHEDLGIPFYRPLGVPDEVHAEGSGRRIAGRVTRRIKDDVAKVYI